MNETEFKEKVEEFYEKRGIASKMRTHLRKLLLSEIQNAPCSVPKITVRARALGCLLVEWLLLHECHCTLSVLVSEVPSLADLPSVVGEGDQKRLKVEEVRDVLIALGLNSEEIVQEFENSQQSLLACIIKITSTWRGRLDFKELNIGSSSLREPSRIKLQEAVANVCLDPGQMPNFYIALHSLIQNEVESHLKEEREALKAHVLTRDNVVSNRLQLQEENLVTRLTEAQEDFEATKEKVNEELSVKRELLNQLIAEVQSQHEMVIDCLAAFEEKTKQFEDSKKAWSEKVSLEEQRLLIQTEELSSAKKELEMERQRLAEELKTKEAEAKTQDEVVKDVEVINELKEVKQTIKGVERTLSPVSAPSSSISCSASTTNTAGVNDWGRLKELRDETRRGKEAFIAFLNEKIEIESDSEHEEPSLPIRSHIATQQRRSQLTFPRLHEGCHADPNLSNTSTHRARLLSNKYRHLLSQGDQPMFPRSSTRIPLPSASTSVKSKQLTQRMREESCRLENLISSARPSAPCRPKSPINIKALRESKKLDTLLKNIRPNTPSSCESREDDIQFEESKESDRSRDGPEERLSAVAPKIGINERKEKRVAESNAIGDGVIGQNLPKEVECGLPPVPNLDDVLKHALPDIKMTKIPGTKIPGLPRLSRPSSEKKEMAGNSSSSPSQEKALSRKEKTSLPVLKKIAPTDAERGLMQTMLDTGSELSEGEVVSPGRHSAASEDFWD